MSRAFDLFASVVAPVPIWFGIALLYNFLDYDTSSSFLWHHLLRRNPFICITYGDIMQVVIVETSVCLDGHSCTECLFSAESKSAKLKTEKIFRLIACCFTHSAVQVCDATMIN